ncbi:LysR family transcriptional regulator [Roseomonas rosulenta]|uniref:LysR family transcriptional regulator n=1 Tax=Roseomonas rosulenta TaxID=2748667 RepID=UPI0018DEFD85|nr:LysR family transcriptional regulator [Roseomonas rosulenta]
MERKRGSAPTRGHLDGSINLRALQLATHVERYGSIRLAARSAKLSPSVVSRRIRELEDELGVSLFERRPSGVRTTAAGARFLRAALRMFAELEGATGAARAAGSGLVGQLVVGTYFSASIGHFRDALLRFVGRHCGVELSVVEGDREQLLSDLRRGRTDVAILLGPHDEVGLDLLTLWQEAGMVALPAQHPLAEAPLVQWQDLANDTFIVTSRGSGPEVRATVRDLLPRGRSPRFATHDVSREGMFNLVGAGFGVAVLAESASGASYPGVVFRPVGNETGPTMVEAAAYWDPKRDNPVLRRFLSLLRARHAAGSRGA